MFGYTPGKGEREKGGRGQSWSGSHLQYTAADSPSTFQPIPIPGHHLKLHVFAYHLLFVALHQFESLQWIYSAVRVLCSMIGADNCKGIKCVSITKFLSLLLDTCPHFHQVLPSPIGKSNTLRC